MALQLQLQAGGASPPKSDLFSMSIPTSRDVLSHMMLHCGATQVQRVEVLTHRFAGVSNI